VIRCHSCFHDSSVFFFCDSFLLYCFADTYFIILRERNKVFSASLTNLHNEDHDNLYALNKRYCTLQGKGKGKAIQLHAWTGPEGSRRLRFPDFKTFGTRRW
jgi:hypothetical protein